MSDQPASHPTNQPVNQQTNQPASRPTDRLPDLPSELLELALKDLKGFGGVRNHDVRMHKWLGLEAIAFSRGQIQFDEGLCCACLAGSAMFSRFQDECKAALTQEYLDDDVHDNHQLIEITPGSLRSFGVSQGDIKKLGSLNHFRLGWLGFAYEDLDREMPEGMEKGFRVSGFHCSSDMFFADMECLIKYLESFGE